MTVRLNPYLSFPGTAREAMEFYRSVLGGELTVDTYGDLFGSDDPAQRDKVAHGMLETERGLVLMGADTPDAPEAPSSGGSSVALMGDDEAELRRCWEGLSAGGKVVEPLVQAPWGDTFGMCVDRFGTPWMVNIAGPSSSGP